MDKKIAIKRITKIDASIISQLNLIVDPGNEWDNEQGTKYLENTDNALFLVYINEKVVGFLTAHRLQRFDKRKAEVLIYEVAVDESFRQQGIGKQLIAVVKNWAKEKEADEVWVLTNQANKAAMALYTSMGGTIEATDEQMFTFKV